MTTTAALLKNSNHPDADARLRLFRDMGACFAAFDVRIAGALSSGAIIVQAGEYGAMWWLNDNGGEFNLRRINDDGPEDDIPYEHNDLMIDGATAAYRLRCVLTGEPVDYSRRLATDLDTLRDDGPRPRLGVRV